MADQEGHTWSLIYEGFQTEKESLREALCTLGNGYFATRGAAPESKADEVHYPGTYLAGGYNRLTTEIAGRAVENEDLVNLPNWLVFTFRVAGGPWFDLKQADLLSYRQQLDLKRGVLRREARFRDADGRISRLVQRRLVHMANPHLGALEITLIPENWSGEVEFSSALDGTVINSGVRRYRQLNSRHLVPLENSGADGRLYLKVRTSQSEIAIAQAARHAVFRDSREQQVEFQHIERPGYAGVRFSVEARQDEPVTVDKIIALVTSRDRAVSECGLEARKFVDRAGGFAELLSSHSLTWDHLWQRFDIELEHVHPEEGAHAERILRLHVFHLLQTVSPNTIGLDVGVPARGLHGEAYRGHIFWDELFIFPLLNVRIAQITRSLLLYRHRRLNEARQAARQAGFRGAMYPWQSGSDGQEETQQLHLNPRSGRWLPDNTQLQRHVSLAIAYNMWQYFQVSGDLEFLSYFGAEVILEITRFFASLTTYNAHLDRYEILGVMGPDEYHDAYPDADRPGLNNNAYTNVMAAWVMWTAIRVLHRISEDRARHLRETIRLGDDELEQWEEMSRKMRVVFFDEGIISQFEGYEKLQEFDWEGYQARYGNIHRLDRILEAEGDSTNRYKVSKQADVLMLFYLFSAPELTQLLHRLGYDFDPQSIPRNIDYYMQRVSHGSTLSNVVHSWVLARSDRARSWRLFLDALESDVSDVQGGTTPEGIHLGAMAGTVDLIQRAYTGLELRHDVLWFSPVLPEDLKRLAMNFYYRGHSLRLEVTQEKLMVCSCRGPKEVIRVGFNDQIYELKQGDKREFRLG